MTGRKKIIKDIRRLLTALLILLVTLLAGVVDFQELNGEPEPEPETVAVHEEDGMCALVNDNRPDFTEAIQEKARNGFIALGRQDKHGRCTACTASLSRETMPAADQEREDISMIHPSGWRSGQGWERCHLIAFQLSGLNAEKRNLITGTHQLNVSGMLPFENQVADYIHRTGNHVLYRVTPKFRGKEMVARSVEMEALSIEDRGRGVSYHVEVYNRSPGAEINYKTGEVTSPEGQGIYADEERVYVVNINTGKFHYPSCNSAKATSEKNRREVKARRSELIKEGYEPCGNCEP